MNWVLILVGVIIIPTLVYFAYKAYIGRTIGKHIFLFERRYDKVYSKTLQSNNSITSGLYVFRDCPVLNKLNDDDYALIGRIIGDTPKPKELMVKLLYIDSGYIVDDLKSEEFLNQMAEIYRKGYKKDEYGFYYKDNESVQY